MFRLVGSHFLFLLDFKIDTEQRLHVTKLTFNSQIEEEVRNRKLLDESSLDKIFCSIQSIYQSHEMFNLVLASRLNEWTVHGKLGDIICASVSKQSTLTDNLNPSNWKESFLFETCVLWKSSKTLSFYVNWSIITQISSFYSGNLSWRHLKNSFLLLDTRNL